MRSGDPRWLAHVTRLTLLASLALAAPLFALADLHPDYFTSYHCDGGDILIVSLVVWLGPPLALTGLARSLGRRAGGALVTLASWLLIAILSGVLGEVAGVTGARWHLPAALAAAAALTPSVSKLPQGPRGAAACWLVAAAVPAHFLTLSTVSVTFLAGSAPARPPPAMKNPVPVVMIVLDELPLSTLLRPDGQLDARLFPGFARLAARSTWYRNATTVDPYTFGAIPAMLTGNLAKPFEPPSSAVYPDNLFTLFASGDVQAFEATRMLPVSQGTRRRYKGARLDRLAAIALDVSLVLPLLLTGDGRNGPRLAEVSQKFQMFTGQRLFFGRLPAPTEYFQEFVDSAVSWKPGGFYYFHNLLPHPPWNLLPQGSYYESAATAGYQVTITPVPRFPGKALQEMTWTRDPYLVRQGFQRHVLQTMFTDRQLGELLDQLERTRLLDRALLIVTSDHGAYYGAGRKVRGYVGPGVPPARGEDPEPSLAFLYCVPLFIKYPGQTAGVVSDANVEHIDLVPTVADVLKVEVPWTVTGRSLLSPSPERPIKRAMTALAEPVELPRDIPEKLADAASRRAWFDEPSATGAFPWVYRPEPFGARIGHPLAGVPVAAAPDLTVLLDDGSTPPPPWAPAGTAGSLKGCIQGPRLRQAPVYLVLAHRGMLVATARVAFPGRESSPFLMLFPESIDGRDPALEVHAITSAPGAPLALARPARVTRGRLDACYTLPR